MAESPKVALFIHGAGGGGWEWKLCIPVFERAGWQCLAPDLQPALSGISTTHLTDYLEQTRRWAYEAGPSPVVIVGASMGGLLALKASETISTSAVVLVNSVPPAGIKNPTQQSFPPIIEWSQGTLEDSEMAMPDSDDGIVELAYQSWRDESGAVLNEIRQGVEVEWPNSPVLVIAGEDDEDVPALVARSIAARWPAELRIYEEMGHLSPLLGRAAPGVAQDVLHWLEKSVR